jgi:hypothetical protein
LTASDPLTVGSFSAGNCNSVAKSARAWINCSATISSWLLARPSSTSARLAVELGVLARVEALAGDGAVVLDQIDQTRFHLGA